MGYLSDVARRRIAAVLLLAGVVLAALAIADIGPFSDPETEEQRAQAAVEQFFNAARDEDFETVCAQLTPQSKTILAQSAGSAASQQGLTGCVDLMRKLVGDRLSQTRITKIDRVSVSGNHAVVDANIRTSESKRAQPLSLDLFLSKGDWRIDFSFGG
jgi:hypothetical protein